MTKEKFLDAFVQARRVSTPLISINTVDPKETIDMILALYNGQAPPTFEWDSMRGFTPLNEQGERKMPKLPPGNPAEAIDALREIDEECKALIFVHNLHLWFQRAPQLSQAIRNLRDPFKATTKTLVMLSPSMQLPLELQQDVTVLDQPLPTVEDLEQVARQTYDSVDLKPSEDDLRLITDATIGLSSYSAEQVIAMSLKPGDGTYRLNKETLWARKAEMIAQTPGLRVDASKFTYSDIGGCENVKEFNRRICSGPDKPRCIVFIDEGEKAFAGSAGDNTGVSQAFLGTTLTEMQEMGYDGSIYIGPPGSGKSMVGTSTGREFDMVSIFFDLTAMKNAKVGESEANLRAAFKTVRAISDGKALFIMTVNSMANLPPELRRRFTVGTFFFDLPTKEERDMIWAGWLAKVQLSPAQAKAMPEDTGWTGAEIRNCCRIAKRTGMTLAEAANYIVPVAVSAKTQIEMLRNEANGCYLSAAKPGIYKADTFEKFIQANKSGRKISATVV